MARLTALYVDFQDRPSCRAWRWLSLVPDAAGMEVRPFPADQTGAGGGPWERTVPSSAGLELLALGELAREGGAEVHRAFIDEAFNAVHDADTDMSSLEAWLALGSRLGLDLDAFTADSERWRAEVGLWHAEARDELGVTAVPTLVFVDGAGDLHGLYVQLDEDVADHDDAARLLRDLADLIEHPVAQVRRAG